MDEFLDDEDSADPDEKIARFFAAVKGGDAETVEEILADNLSFQHENLENGYAAIHYAVAYRCRAVVRVLLKYGCNLSVKDPLGRTPATIAVEVADDPRLGAALREFEFRRARRAKRRVLDKANQVMVDHLQRMKQTKVLLVPTRTTGRAGSPWSNPPKKR